MSTDYAALLHEIRDQTRLTNGRVSQLEGDMHDVRDVLYGDPERKTDGLVAQAAETAQMVRQWRSLAKVGQWVIGVLAAVFISLMVNLANGLLG